MLQTLVNTCIVISIVAMIIASAIDVIFQTAVKDLLGIEIFDDYEDINSYNIMTKSKNHTFKQITQPIPSPVSIGYDCDSEINTNLEVEDILNSIVDKIVLENTSY